MGRQKRELLAAVVLTALAIGLGAYASSAIGTLSSSASSSSPTEDFPIVNGDILFRSTNQSTNQIGITDANCLNFGPSTGGNQWWICGKANSFLKVYNNSSEYSSWRLSDGYFVGTVGVEAPIVKATSQFRAQGGATYLSSGNSTGGVSYACGATSGDTCFIQAAIGAAAATNAIPAFKFYHSNGALDATDLLVDVGDNAVSKFSVNARGDVGSNGSFNMSTNATALPANAGIYCPASSTLGFAVNSTTVFTAAQTEIDLAYNAGTAGSGTGYTTNATGALVTKVHKVTMLRTALTNAATTEDENIWLMPAKTRVLRVVADVTAGFDDAAGPISAVTMTCGITAGGAEYLASGSVFTANTRGDAAAEIGANLLSATVADIPSMSSTTQIQCRFTSTGGNLSTLTTGAVTFYIIHEVLP